MKRIIMTAAVLTCLSSFTLVQAQDTTRHSQNKSGTMKKGKTQKKMKTKRQNNPDSTGSYGTPTNRRRDSMQGNGFNQ